MATLAAVAVMASQSTWARRSELGTDQAQAQIMVRAGIDWTRAVLSDDRRLSNVDHLGEPWALRLPPIPLEKGSVEGYIEDQQGLFNLNNVVSDGKANVQQLVRYRRLLALLSLPPQLADTLVDWIDADSEPISASGAEDSYYSALASPYLAANRTLSDFDELELIRGYDANVIARLKPFVSILPPGTAVNTNTARAEVLAAVVDGLELADARTLVAQRDRIYFRDVSEFMRQLPAQATVDRESVAVSSDYFTATLRAELGGAEARGSVLLARKTTSWPTIVRGKYL